MISHHAALSGSLQDIQMPPVGVDRDALRTLCGVACRKLALSVKFAEEALNKEWFSGPMTAANVADLFVRFDALCSVIDEAQRMLSFRVQEGIPQRFVRPTILYLSNIQKGLRVELFKLLSQAEDPLAVFRVLHAEPEIRAISKYVSALFGLCEERVGGDADRHTVSERTIFYSGGGFMYQASEFFGLRQLFNGLSLKPGSTFYDLGSGYGHALFHGAALYPETTFKGIELMSVRVDECRRVQQRIGLKNLSFQAGDVTKGGFSDADIIFLFNPFPLDTQREVVAVLDELVRTKPVAIIDYEGCVTQTSLGVRTLARPDLSPYRLVVSKKFMHESCALVGMSAPVR